MLRSFLTLLLVVAASPPTLAQLAFELANPLVVVDGERAAVEGAPLRQRAFGALLVEAPGWGTLRVSDAPFPGARRAGDFDRTRLVIVLGGRSLRLRSSTPLLSAPGPVPAYVRLETDAGVRASGPVRLSLAGAPDRPPEAPPERRSPPAARPPSEILTDATAPSRAAPSGAAGPLRAEIAILTAERDGLRAALADAQRDIADAQRDRDDARLRLDALRDEVDRLQRALAAARLPATGEASPSARADALRAERDALRRERDRLRDELASAQAAPATPRPAASAGQRGEPARARISLPDFDLARLDNADETQARIADTPYPEWAAASRLGGDVLVLFQTDARGTVVRTAVPRPIGGGLDAIAEEIVRAMRFTPVRADGQATRLRSQVVVRFTP